MPVIWDSKIRPPRPNRSSKQRTRAKRHRRELRGSGGKHLAEPTQQTLSAEGQARSLLNRDWRAFWDAETGS